jgi:hypothetical protein
MEQVLGTLGGIAILIAGLWGLLIGIAVLMKRRQAPRWVRWLTTFIGGAYVFWAIIAIIAPDGPSVDLLVRQGVGLLDIGLVLAIWDICNRVATRRTSRHA